MSAARPLIRRTWPVGERTVTLTILKAVPGRPARTTAEWSPNQPSTLTADEWREYRSGRHQALEEIAAELGISVAVLDL